MMYFSQSLLFSFIDGLTLGPAMTVTVIVLLGVIIGVLSWFVIQNSSLKRQVNDTSMQDDLTRRNAHYSALISSIGDGIVTTDPEGNVTFINNAAMTMLKIDSLEQLESTVGKHVTEVMKLVDETGNQLVPEQTPMYEAVSMQKRVDSSMSVGDLHVMPVGCDPFPISFTASPIYLAGEIAGCAITFRDNSWQEEIDHAKDEFVNLASHQLRTPITTINWYIELLEKAKGSEYSEQELKLLKRLKQGSDSMHALVVELLDVSRLEMTNMVIDPQPTNLVELCNSVIADKKNTIDAYELQLQTDYSAEDISVAANKGFLQIAIENLLSNAIKYNSKKGNVTVSIQQLDQATEIDGVSIKQPGGLIQIADTGLGIPDEQQSKIFSKMFRADNVRLLDVQGTGLGLYMVHMIITKMNGNIWFTSVEGEGTTFKIYLPAVQIQQ